MISKKENNNKQNFISTFKAILWSFVGLRRGSDYEKDNISLNPIYVILAGLIGVSLFIISLILIIKYIIL